MKGSQYRRVVVKLSGSVFNLEDLEEIKGYAELFKGLNSDGIQAVVIAGGGREARRYIDAARALGADESSLDEFGIDVSRLNARLLIHALGDYAYPYVPRDLQEVGIAVESDKVVVTGGLHPGQSTNATSALIAERVKASIFVNATDVDGIYTADPRLDKDARLIKRIGVKELLAMLMDERFNAGTYELMDIVALKVIERSKIPTRVIKASSRNIKMVIDGEDIGTYIMP